jgi:hypothetical protein
MFVGHEPRKGIEHEAMDLARSALAASPCYAYIEQPRTAILRVSQNIKRDRVITLISGVDEYARCTY